MLGHSGGGKGVAWRLERKFEHRAPTPPQASPKSCTLAASLCYYYAFKEEPNPQPRPPSAPFLGPEDPVLESFPFILCTGKRVVH